jgi:rhodanese-related sulfurtransferase
MKSLTALEFEALRTSGENYQLIDVREPFEAEIATMHGELMPLNTVLEHTEAIAKDRKVVVHCRSGKRSADAILRLENVGFTNLYNLEGGILGYSDAVDPTIPKY